MARITPHEDGEQKPTDESRQDQELGESTGAWSRAIAEQKMGGAFGAIEITEFPQEQLPLIDDRLRLLIRSFNGEFNGDVSMESEVMIEQALRIMADLGVDLVTRMQYAQALYATFRTISKPGTQFVAFDSDTSMKIFESPTDTPLSLKVDAPNGVPGLFVPLADGKRHSVLGLAAGDKIRTRYEHLIENARARAQEQMIDMPKGSPGPAEAVIGYASLGRDLLIAPPSLNLGKAARGQANEAQKRLQRYGIEIAEVMQAAGGQGEPETLRAFVSVMVQLQRLDSNKDAVLKMLKTLDNQPPTGEEGRLEEHMSGLNDSLVKARAILRGKPDTPPDVAVLQ